MFGGDFVGYSVTYVQDKMKTLVVRMHGIIHKCMKYLTNERSFYVVKSGVNSCQKYLRTQCASKIVMDHIIHITRLSSDNFCCVYHAMVFDGEWINGIC